MTDQPQDLLPGWTEDELALLRSADGDRPSTRSLPAALAAASVGTAIATSAASAHGAALTGAAGAAAAGAKWSGAVAISKWIAVVALAGTVAAGGAVLLKRSSAGKTPAARSAQEPGRAARPERVAPPAVTARTEEVALPEVVEPARAEGAPAAAPEPVAASTRAARRAPPAQPDIRVELAAIDAAMKTLRAGNVPAALAALDRYDAEYERSGTLHVEATALRIEALLLTGQHAQAEALAATFLSRHPRSPYATRIRGLLARP